MADCRLSSGRAVYLALFLIASATHVSNSQPPVNNDHENQQRAIRLLQFDKEIGLIPEADLRIPLRFNILEFIYKNEVRSQYAAAEPMLAAYFEDVRTQEKALVPRTSYKKNLIALLLRKHYPEIAKAVETKYLIQVDTSDEDLDELQKKGNPNEIVDRAIANLYAKGSLDGAGNIYDRVRLNYPELGVRLLDAALDMTEKDPTVVNTFWLERWMILTPNQPPPEVTPEQMLRYYRILVTAARGELSRAYPKDYYVRTTWPLRRALPDIQRVDPRLAAEARAIVSKYRRLIPKEQVLREEADDRIESADDKVARAIAEAESAETVEQKDYFWVRASGLSRPKREGNYKPAVDLTMKASPAVSTSDPKSRDQHLRTIAYWAQAFRDYEGAKYAVDRIQDDQIRADALLAYANELGRMNINERPKAAAIADDAIRQIDKAGPTDRSVCEIGNSRSLMTLHTTFTNINDMTARTVRIINNFPESVTNSEPGTIERTEFVTLSTRSMILCSGYIFRPVWTGSPAPNPGLTNEIKAKEWRLAAQIESEKYRLYPSTQ